MERLVGAQKRQAILLVLYFGELSIDKIRQVGISRSELLQTIHKLKKDGYTIVYNKERRAYYLSDKSKPLVLDVKVIRRLGDNMIEGLILGSLPVIIYLTKTKPNGSVYLRIKCKITSFNDKLVLKEV